MLKYITGLLFLLIPVLAQATPEQVWQESMKWAQQGSDRAAIAVLDGALLQAEQPDAWTQRFEMAKILLNLRREARLHQEYNPPRLPANNAYAALLEHWLNTHPMPRVEPSVMPQVLGAVIPGAGHAWLGRWDDAGVAAMLVWPLLILTLWAARRDMGPVTVFFALITAWLWSGTVFSATSLAERGDFEMYYAWWQEMWTASGLPSKPW